MPTRRPDRRCSVDTAHDAQIRRQSMANARVVIHDEHPHGVTARQWTGLAHDHSLSRLHTLYSPFNSELMIRDSRASVNPLVSISLELRIRICDEAG